MTYLLRLFNEELHTLMRENLVKDGNIIEGKIPKPNCELTVSLVNNPKSNFITNKVL